MKEIGQLLEADGQFEFRDPSRSLIVRGEHPEWVLMAAAEMIANTSRLEAESLIDEKKSLLEFEAAEQVEVDAAVYALKERFEIVPQCIVTIGRIDYKWAAAEGRALKPDEFGKQAVRRVHDMSLTRNDTFLSNEDGVEIPE